MNELLAALSRFMKGWVFWVVVGPWEIGVRIRLGKTAASLYPGFHWRIPLLDEVALVNTRLRIGTAPSVTLRGTTRDRVRVVTAVVGYRVVDPVMALQRYTRAESVVLSAAQAEMAHGAEPAAVLRVLEEMFRPHGIVVEFVQFAEDVEVRALRLMTAQNVVQGDDPQESRHRL